MNASDSIRRIVLCGRRWHLHTGCCCALVADQANHLAFARKSRDWVLYTFDAWESDDSPEATAVDGARPECV